MERERGKRIRLDIDILCGGGRCEHKERGLIFFYRCCGFRRRTSAWSACENEIFAGGPVKGYVCENKNIIAGGVLCRPLVKIVFTYGPLKWFACKNIFSQVDECLNPSCYLHRRLFGSEMSTCLGKNIPTFAKLVFLVVERFQICFASFIV